MTYLPEKSNINNYSITYNSIGHEVMPVEFSAAVVLLVEVFHFWDEVFQLSG